MSETNTTEVEQKLKEMEKQVAKEKELATKTAAKEGVEPSAKDDNGSSAAIDNGSSAKVDNNAPTSSDKTVSAKSRKASSTRRTEKSDSKGTRTTGTAGQSESSISWFSLINFMLILALLVAAGYGWWQYQQQNLALNNQLAQLQQQNQQQQNQQQQIINDLQSRLDQSIAEQQQKQIDLLTQVTTAEQQLMEMAGRRSQDWLLAEADYLVQMAGRKLWLEKDVDTSIAMLRAADNRIADLKDVSLLPVRQMISNDVTLLSGLQRVSQPEMALQLNSIIQLIDTLPLKAIELPPSSELEVDSQLTNSVADWQSNLMKVWHELVEGFITVRQRQENVEPLMLPQQQWYLKENLKNQLLQGQIALLKQQQQLYSQAMLQSADWLTQYFDNNDSAVAQQIELINQLALQQIAPDYPTSLSSILGLQDVMQQRLSNIHQQQEPVQ